MWITKVPFSFFYFFNFLSSINGLLTGSKLNINLLLNGNTLGISGRGGSTLLNTLCRKNGEKQFEAISCHVRDMTLALATLLVLLLPLSYYFFLFFCWLPSRLWPSIDKKVFFRCGKCSAKCKQLRLTKGPRCRCQCQWTRSKWRRSSDC